jgi:hypothetical protein
MNPLDLRLYRHCPDDLKPKNILDFDFRGGGGGGSGGWVARRPTSEDATHQQGDSVSASIQYLKSPTLLIHARRQKFKVPYQR